MKELGGVFTDARSIHKAYTGQLSEHRENLGEKKFEEVVEDLYNHWESADTLEPETIFAIIKAFQIDTRYYNFWVPHEDHVNEIFGSIITRLDADAELERTIDENLQDLLGNQMTALKELRRKNPKAVYDGRCIDEFSLDWRLTLSTISYILDNGFT